MAESRYVFFHDLEVVRKPKRYRTHEVPPIRILLDGLLRLSRASMLMEAYEESRGCVALLDAQIVEGDFAVLLLACGDTRFTARDLINISRGEHRELEISPEEASAYSAHVLISLRPAGEASNLYPCLVEKVVGVPKSLMLQLLNKQLKPLFTTTVQEGARKPEDSWPAFDLLARPSKHIRRRADKAVLKGVVLTSPVATQRLPDSMVEVKDVEQRLSISITPVPIDDGASAIVRLWREWGVAHDYTNLRVRIQEPNGGTYLTNSYDAAADAKEFVTVHHDVIHVEKARLFEKVIRPDVTKAMIELFRRHGEELRL